MSYDIKSQSWSEVGKMKYDRAMHGVSVVKIDDVLDEHRGCYERLRRQKEDNEKYMKEEEEKRCKQKFKKYRKEKKRNLRKGLENGKRSKGKRDRRG